MSDKTYDALVDENTQIIFDGLLTGGGKGLKSSVGFAMVRTAQWANENLKADPEALMAAVAARLSESGKDTTLMIRLLAAIKFHVANKHKRSSALLEALDAVLTYIPDSAD